MTRDTTRFVPTTNVHQRVTSSINNFKMAADPEIPPQLLQSLLQLHSEDKKTRISQPALNSLAEYMKTFVREAIYRAAEERKQTDGADQATSVGSMFLEV